MPLPRVPLLPLLLLLSAFPFACGSDPDTTGATGSSSSSSSASSSSGNPPPPDGNFCSRKTLSPWSRKSEGLGGALSLNEVMYHPGPSSVVEWVEVYNPLGIQMDISGFRLDGDIAYVFPEGTVVPSRGYLVVASNAAQLDKEVGHPVAMGTFIGQLPNDKGTIEIWNNADRLLDSMTYTDEEPWTMIPDGSGASLSKRIAGTVSDAAENWTKSAHVGGTPAADNFPETNAPKPTLSLVPMGSNWKYFSSATTPPAQWKTVGFDDSAWQSGDSAFYGSNAPAMNVTTTARFTADNFFALYVGKADGSGLKLIGRDSVGDWSSAETFVFDAAPDDVAYVAAWEAPGNSGGPQSLIGQFELADGTIVSTSPEMFEWVAGPMGGSPGGLLSDPAPSLAVVTGLIASANQGQSWAKPEASAPNTSAPWGWAFGGVFVDSTQFVWGDTFNDVSISNTLDTYLLFRTKGPIVPPKGATEIPLGTTTTYFRTTFQAPSDVVFVQPWIDALVDDGAVFYLNGNEVFRLRMPNGAVSASTFASSAVVNATLSAGVLVDPSALVSGTNVLAVEVHQAVPNDSDMAFDASLSSSVMEKPQTMAANGLVVNEIAGSPSAGGFWLELANRGMTPLDLGGYVIASSTGAEHLISAGMLMPGELRLLDAAELGFEGMAGDKLFIYSPDRQQVLDGAQVLAVPRARSDADPTALWYPDQATPGAPNAFVAQPAIVINEIMFHAPPMTLPDGSRAKDPLEWIELYNRGQTAADLSGFQLVDAIEYELPAGTIMQPGGYLIITKDAMAMRAAYPALQAAPPEVLLGDYTGGLSDSGENLVLRDACGNPVDAVPYGDGGRWPEAADGGGSTLELRESRADHRSPEAWAASDSSAASAWQTITYEGIAAPSSVGPDGVYQEFVLGMLDAGIALVDDVSVLEDPDGLKTQLIQNGTFEAQGASAWRILGNHRHSEVVIDPTNPQNHVLRLVSTGPTEHMHNHLETTLANAATIKNGTKYRISLRAKWVSGSNQLNTRLYFDRLAKTTELGMPGAYGTPLAANGKAEANIGPTYAELQHSPAVPGPYEPVKVSVFAADPDGVGDLSLFYSIDGNGFLSAPMTAQGDGHFSGLLPGAAASSIVQFYVSGKDQQGAISLFPARGPASRALYKVDDGLASQSGLHNLRIVLTPQDTNWMFEAKNLMSNDLVGATIIDDERRAYYDVGVRLKSSERGRGEIPRVGFALSFPPTDPFRGVYRTFMVDRSEGVGYGQRELFFNQAMNHAGTVTSQYDDLVKVLTPRPEHVSAAHLQMARFGDLLLDYQFEQGGSGTVFEYELIYYPTTTDTGTPEGNKLPQPDNVVGIPIQDLGPDKEAYRLPFIIKNNRWRDDYAGLMSFAKVFGQAGGAFDAQIESAIDVDEWLRAFAFCALSGVVDNYGTGSQHNGNFYVRPVDSRVLFFPHDLDFYGGWAQSPIVNSGDLGKLIANPTRRRLFYSHLYDILKTSYNSTYMSNWATHFAGLLPAQDFAGHLQFVAERSDWVMNGAPDAVMKAIPKVAFSITTNGGAPLSVTTATVQLGGIGWLDVDSIWTGSPAAPIPLLWTNQNNWTATVSLVCGANTLKLDAIDRHGLNVGTDTMTVTRTGAGCP